MKKNQQPVKAFTKHLNILVINCPMGLLLDWLWTLQLKYLLQIIILKLK